MATLARYEDRQVAIGRVYARAFATIAANPVAVFGIAFLFGALPATAISLATTALATTALADGFNPHSIMIGASAWFGSIIFAMMTQGALVRITVAHAEGRRLSIASALGAGVRAALPLFLLSVSMTIAIGFGLALFIIPGMMLYVIWSVAAPALVEERRGAFAALARSRALTKGARWRVFALELVVLVFYWLIAGVIGIGSIFFAHLLNGGERDALWSAIWTIISATLSGAVWGTVQTSLYVELRDWKDGPASDRLADIFA